MHLMKGEKDQDLALVKALLERDREKDPLASLLRVLPPPNRPEHPRGSLDRPLEVCRGQDQDQNPGPPLDTCRGRPQDPCQDPYLDHQSDLLLQCRVRSGS